MARRSFTSAASVNLSISFNIEPRSWYDSARSVFPEEHSIAKLECLRPYYVRRQNSYMLVI